MLTDNTLGYSRLQLHIHTPNLDDIWLEGYEQGIKEYAESNNPFPEDTQEHRHWDDGWWAGFYNEDPMFEHDNSTKPDATESSYPQSTSQHTISFNQWFLACGEICSGGLASFAAFQLANHIL
jgi:hypothetical protein